MEETRSGEMPWYQRWFGREYLEVYRHRNEEEAVRDMDGVERLLGAPLPEPILDLACGAGRHSIELARRGYEVVGVDLSETLLAVAREEARKRNLRIEFIRGDMRDPPAREHFGTAINMFTSFGYFENDKENARIMSAIFTALRPGGRYIIDYINRERVLATLVPQDEKEIGGRTVRQHRRYNPVMQRLEKTITIISGKEEQTFVESVRLFTAAEMKEMAVGAGLIIDGVHGAVDGGPAGADAPRLVLHGQKPDA